MFLRIACLASIAYVNAKRRDQPHDNHHTGLKKDKKGHYDYASFDTKNVKFVSQTEGGVETATEEIKETNSYLIDEDVVSAAGVKLGGTPSEYCCVIKKGRHFRWKTLEYCVEES